MKWYNDGMSKTVNWYRTNDYIYAWTYGDIHMFKTRPWGLFIL